MMNLICLMDHILYQIYNITLNTLLKNNRIVFKIKTGYKLKLLSKETMKLLGSTEKVLPNIKMVKMYQN